MKMLKFIQPKPLLGIDVSQNSIRILELNKNGNTITTCILAPLLKNHADETNNIIATLKMALKNNPITARKAIIALSYSAIIHKTILIPAALNDKELTEFLKLNLEKYIGIPPAQSSFDYHVAEKNTTNTTIDLIAVRKERIEKCKTILGALKLKPQIIDIDAFALARATYIICQPTAPIVAVNLDYATILTCALDNHKILYAHEDFLDNTQLKNELSKQLLHHLQMCTAALQQQPSQLILSGECAMEIQTEEIAALTHLPTSVINPLAKFKLAPHLNGVKIKQTASAFAIALGLALRRINDV